MVYTLIWLISKWIKYFPAHFSHLFEICLEKKNTIFFIITIIIRAQKMGPKAVFSYTRQNVCFTWIFSPSRFLISVATSSISPGRRWGEICCRYVLAGAPKRYLNFDSYMTICKKKYFRIFQNKILLSNTVRTLEHRAISVPKSRGVRKTEFRLNVKRC